MPKPRDIESTAFRVIPRTGRRRAKSSGRIPALVSKKARKLVPDLSQLKAGRFRGWPEPSSKTQLCKPVSETRPEKACFVRVLFVGAKLAAKHGKREGAYLIGCNRSPKPSYHPMQWIPVFSHGDAKTKADRFCRCRARGEDADVCARNASGKRRRR
jgi:hypothetical protein